MKKAILITVLGLCNTLCAMQEEPITFPDAAVIRKRLLNQGMPETALDKTKVDTFFANKTMLPSRIPTELKTQYKKKFPHCTKTIRNTAIQSDLPKTVAALLSDYPRAIKNLKEQGLLQ